VAFDHEFYGRNLWVSSPAMGSYFLFSKDLADGYSGADQGGCGAKKRKKEIHLR
jgi:hypothetical protein